MSNYSIFTGSGGHTDLTLPTSSTTYSGSIVMGNEFYVTASNLYLKGYKYYVADTNAPTTPQKFALWQPDNSALTYFFVGAVTTSGTLSVGWNTASLSTPIPLSPNIPYIAMTGLTGNFSDTSGFWTTGGPGAAGLSNGPLGMYSNMDGSAPDFVYNVQSAFSTGNDDPSVLPPSQGNNAFNSWVDVIVTDVVPAGVSYRTYPNMIRAFPAGGTTNDTTGYTLGMEFSLSRACTLNNIWHYSTPGCAALPTRCAIWDVATQTVVAGTDNTSPTWLTADGSAAAAGDGWVKCTYTSIVLNANQNYKVSTFNGPGTTWFEATANYWSSGLGANGQTSGPLIVPNNASATTPGQQSWNTATWGYPDTSDNPEVDWVDVEVTPLTVSPVNAGAFLTFFS